MRAAQWSTPPAGERYRSVCVLGSAEVYAFGIVVHASVGSNAIGRDGGWPWRVEACLTRDESLAHRRARRLEVGLVSEGISASLAEALDAANVEIAKLLRSRQDGMTIAER